MSLKKPMTPWGIDPGTVRLVAQRLNHYATAGPSQLGTCKEIIAVCTDIHTRTINTFCRYNVELLNVSFGGEQSNE
jgi:hypothetical protein